MKRPLFSGGIIAVCVVAAAGFWLAHRSKATLDPGILIPKINVLAAAWQLQEIPAAERVVNILVGDMQAGARTDKLSEKGGGTASGIQSVSDSEILSIADKPSIFKSALIWFKRTFLRKTASADKAGCVLESLGNIPNAVTWTHKGFETVSEGEMVAELMKAVIKADDAGAQVNIITHGISAAPALKAVKRLGETGRKGNSIAVNKFVALDMNKATLRQFDSGYFRKFKRPGNLREWINIWRSPLPPYRVTMELFSQNHNRKRFYADELFQETGLQLINPPELKATAAEQNVLKFVRILVKQIYVIEKIIDRLAQDAETRAEQKKATAASAQAAGRADKREASAARLRASRPVDSLSAINAGWLKEEHVKTKKANWYVAGNYCGKNGGRLPTINELKDMYKAECEGGRQFNTCGNWYWSSEAESACCAWGVDFYTGGVYRNIKGNDANAVRCVADKQGSGTHSCGRGACRWDDAVDFCKGMGGLPDVNQLQETYQAECTGGKQFNTCGKYYWSSEEAGAGRARFVNFTAGTVHYGNKSNTQYYYARCVR